MRAITEVLHARVQGVGSLPFTGLRTRIKSPPWTMKSRSIRWNEQSLYPCGTPVRTYSPVQNCRKFSAVFGHTSAQSSIWSRPAAVPPIETSAISAASLQAARVGHSIRHVYRRLLTWQNMHRCRPSTLRASSLSAKACKSFQEARRDNTVLIHTKEHYRVGCNWWPRMPGSFPRCHGPDDFALSYRRAQLLNKMLQ